MYSRGVVVATCLKVARRTRRDDERSFSILTHRTSILHPSYVSTIEHEPFAHSFINILFNKGQLISKGRFGIFN